MRSWLDELVVGPTILIEMRQRHWYIYHGTATELIVSYLTRDLAPPELPDYWSMDNSVRLRLRRQPYCEFGPYDAHDNPASTVYLPPAGDSATQNHQP